MPLWRRKTQFTQENVAENVTRAVNNKLEVLIESVLSGCTSKVKHSLPMWLYKNCGSTVAEASESKSIIWCNAAGEIVASLTRRRLCGFSFWALLPLILLLLSLHLFLQDFLSSTPTWQPTLNSFPGQTEHFFKPLPPPCINIFIYQPLSEFKNTLVKSDFQKKNLAFCKYISFSLTPAIFYFTVTSHFHFLSFKKKTKKTHNP